jgi:hypothetical protein
MEEELLKIIKTQCALSSKTVQRRAAKEITAHVFEFIEWFKYDEIFRIVNINGKEKYLNTEKYDPWTNALQLELYLSLDQVYKHWLTEVKK